MCYTEEQIQRMVLNITKAGKTKKAKQNVLEFHNLNCLHELEEILIKNVVDIKSEKNKEYILKLLKAENLNFFIKAKRIGRVGIDLDEYLEMYYDLKREEVIAEYNKFIDMLQFVGISIEQGRKNIKKEMDELVLDIYNMGLDKDKKLKLLCKYNVSKLENLERRIMRYVVGRIEDNKENIILLLKANNLNFFITLNKIARNEYSLEEYNQINYNVLYYSRRFSNIISNKIKDDYNKNIRILQMAGISFSKREKGSKVFRNKNTYFLRSKKFISRF